MARNSTALKDVCDNGHIQMSRKDARRLRLTHNSTVTLTSRRGSITTGVRINTSLPPGMLYMSPSSSMNVLAGTKADPAAKTPAMKACTVKVNKAEKNR
jgi:predicted molibdopterin-dependent oxidoreductase YjgC